MNPQKRGLPKDVLANRKPEAEFQLDENQAEPIPLQLVRKALSDFTGFFRPLPSKYSRP